ncbi:MAG: hypothetical protein KDB27_17505 [Planctomycetales bacterium]|nr:hypothetical protein [Planctomycetales bacterium]
MADSKAAEIDLPNFGQYTVHKLLTWTAIAAVITGVMTPWLRQMTAVQLAIFGGVLMSQVIVFLSATALQASRCNRIRRKAGPSYFAATVMGGHELLTKKTARTLDAAYAVFMVVWLAYCSAFLIADIGRRVFFVATMCVGISISHFSRAYTGFSGAASISFCENGIVVFLAKFIDWGEIQSAYASLIVKNQITFQMRHSKLSFVLNESDFQRAKQLIAEKFPATNQNQSRNKSRSDGSA